MSEFTKLFEPGRIGKLNIKNRIIFPPMVTNFATEERTISDRQIDYYVERAKGGAGLIVVEATAPLPVDYLGVGRIDDEGYVPGLSRLAEAVHTFGTKIFIELFIPAGVVSAIPNSSHREVSAPLGIPDIKKIEEEFGEGAKKAKKAGFDGVMIHGAASYLVANFLSPLSNTRTDEYGGTLERRARFALELVEVTKRKTGSDYPVIFRLMCKEGPEDGFRVKDAIAVCKMLQEVGVDAIDVTAGRGINGANHELAIPNMYMPPGCNAGVSMAIKKEIKIPVSVAGKINNPYLAEKILREGKADFVDVGRGLIADAQFAKKASEGRTEDILQCIACLRCHQAIILEKGPIKCTVNPSIGRERDFELGLRPVKKGKRILVIGGGPGGMEAATIAKKRGHDVTLWEANDKLGGQLNLALVPSGKGDIKSLLDYLKMKLVESNVKVELGKKGTVASVQEFAPDAVIVATGSAPFTLDIPGIKRENVIGYREVLSGRVEIEGNVIVWGAGIVGCETAYFLAGKGRDVTQVFPEIEAAPDVAHPDIRKFVLKKLKENKVKVEAGVKEFKEISSKGMKVINKEGKEILLEADNIILATGVRPDKVLAQSLKDKVPKLYEVGDCVNARRILEAIHEGAEAALRV